MFSTSLGLAGLEPAPFRLKGGRSAARASDPRSRIGRPPPMGVPRDPVFRLKERQIRAAGSIRTSFSRSSDGRHDHTGSHGFGWPSGVEPEPRGSRPRVLPLHQDHQQKTPARLGQRVDRSETWSRYISAPPPVNIPPVFLACPAQAAHLIARSVPK